MTRMVKNHPDVYIKDGNLRSCTKQDVGQSDSSTPGPLSSQMRAGGFEGEHLLCALLLSPFQRSEG